MRRRIFLITTYNCNLRCEYCYEKNKHSGSFDCERIKKVLDSELSSDTFDSFLISFHGGEPFLEFEKIRHLCEWMWEKYAHKDIRASVPTNGTVLTKPIRQWLRLHSDKFEVSLSIDGRKEDHNKARNDSFDRIDFNFFLSLPGIKAKMTVTPDTVGHLFDNFTFLKSIGFDVSFSLGQGLQWTERELEVYSYELKKFVTDQLSKPDEPLLPPFRYKIEHFAPAHHKASRWNCNAGYGEIAYDIKGNYYPCHAYVSQFGDYDAKAIADIQQTLERKSMIEVMTGCSDCLYRYICSPCHGLNTVMRGAMDKIDTALCKYIKLSVKATIYLYVTGLSYPQYYVWLKNRSIKELQDIVSGIRYYESRI